MHDFYGSLAAASTYRQGSQIDMSELHSIQRHDTSDVADHAQLFYAEWGPSFPYTSSPDPVTHMFSAVRNAALFSFDISGVMEMTRFISRKQVRTVAQPLNINLVQPAPVSPEFREQMIARLEQLQFRPRLNAGRPVEASATLIYLSAAPNP